MIEFFTESYKNTPWLVIVLEAITFVFGIASVYFAKKENIWVYPTGLVATTITVYLLYRAGYFGDMVINGYYSIMSIYGWYNWSRKENGTKVDGQMCSMSSIERSPKFHTQLPGSQ